MLQSAETGYELNTDTADRFSFGFLVALVVHLVVVFGVVFDWIETSDTTNDLDVTIVTHYSQEEPDEADFLAQANQEASGALDEASVPTSPASDSRSNQRAKQNAERVAEEGVLEGGSGEPLLSASGTSDSSVQSSDRQNASAEETQTTLASSRQALLDRLDILRQDYAKGPKIGTLTSVAAKVREEAAYQVHMQQRVVEIGNQHYPAESIAQGLYGNLRMRLTILPDGSLESSEIAESSGHQVLDQAAVRIARLSAPFSPFSRELAAKYDKIVFIRTWQFLPGGVLSTQ